MTIDERAVFDGWQHLKMEPEKVLSKTPREFSILLTAQRESIYDDMERMATQAMMNRQAYHAKKLKQAQLFKRPTGTQESKRTIEDLEREEAETMQWLSQFAEFKEKV